LIADILDFIEELNIPGTTYTDEMKRKQPMSYTCASSVLKNLKMFGAYCDISCIAPDSTIRLAYVAIVPMTTFNLLPAFEIYMLSLESGHLRLFQH
jgi:hypothetical protein